MLMTSRHRTPRQPPEGTNLHRPTAIHPPFALQHVQHPQRQSRQLLLGRSTPEGHNERPVRHSCTGAPYAPTSTYAAKTSRPLLQALDQPPKDLRVQRPPPTIRLTPEPLLQRRLQPQIHHHNRPHRPSHTNPPHLDSKQAIRRKERPNKRARPTRRSSRRLCRPLPPPPPLGGRLRCVAGCPPCDVGEPWWLLPELPSSPRGPAPSSALASPSPACPAPSACVPSLLATPRARASGPSAQRPPGLLHGLHGGRP